MDFKYRDLILINSRGKTCDGKRHRYVLELREAIKRKEEKSLGLYIQDLLDVLLALGDESSN